MNKNVSKIWDNCPILIAGLVWIALCTIVIRLTDNLLNGNSMEVVLRSMFCSMTWATTLGCCILTIPYIICCLVGKKYTEVCIGVLSALVVLTESGLCIYARHNGFLLDGEIVARPIAEIVEATIGAMGYTIPIASIIAALTLSVLCCKWMARWSRNKWCIGFIAAMIVCTTCGITKKISDDNIENVDRLHYCLTDSIRYLFNNKQEEVAFNKEFAKKFAEYHSYYNIENLRYPLERVDNGEDVLSEYFETSTKKPNVVMIIVESMGAESMQFMPFLSSLCQRSLYYPNCITTSQRSFGAVPAITGSLSGPAGFLCGKLPSHSSLIQIMKENGYKTCSFYAGPYSFDNVLSYMVSEGVDYYPDLYAEYDNSDEKENGSTWGYHDSILFERAASYMKGKRDEPLMSIITTQSMHDAFNRADTKKQEKYVKMARTKLPSQNKDLAAYYATNYYTDKCLENFFDNIKQSPDYGNTLFIITGDHASGLNIKNDLSYYHVPLIIWSPMLKKSLFDSTVVFHTDIVPSICRLLKNKYGLTTPQKVHWIGNGLYRKEGEERSQMLVNFSRRMNTIVCGTHFFQKKDGDEYVCWKINKDMSLSKEDDKEQIEHCHELWELYKYVYNYTYMNDKLCLKNKKEKEDILLQKTWNNDKEISYFAPEEQQDSVDYIYFNFIPRKKIKIPSEAKLANITISGEWFFCDEVPKYGKTLNLVCEYIDNKINYMSFDPQKTIVTDEITPNKWYPFYLSTNFNVEYCEEGKFIVYVILPSKSIEPVVSQKGRIRNFKATFTYK